MDNGGRLSAHRKDYAYQVDAIREMETVRLPPASMQPVGTPDTVTTRVIRVGCHIDFRLKKGALPVLRSPDPTKVQNPSGELLLLLSKFLRSTMQAFLNMTPTLRPGNSRSLESEESRKSVRHHKIKKLSALRARQ